MLAARPPEDATGELVAQAGGRLSLPHSLGLKETLSPGDQWPCRTTIWTGTDTASHPPALSPSGWERKNQGVGGADAAPRGPAKPREAPPASPLRGGDPFSMVSNLFSILGGKRTPRPSSADSPTGSIEPPPPSGLPAPPLPSAGAGQRPSRGHLSCPPRASRCPAGWSSCPSAAGAQ